MPVTELEPWLDITDNSAAYDIHDTMTSRPTVVPTGLPSIDGALWLWGDRRGIPRGTYMLIGGASNIGKTQVGLMLAKQAADAGERSAILSLDMRKRDAIARIHQALTVGKIPWQDWVPSRWRPEYEQVLKDAIRKYRMSITGAIGIHSGGRRTLDGVELLIREAADVGATFFVVDHVQKIKVGGLGADNIMGRAEVVSEKLDDLCDELNVTICALSQLNRMASRETDRRPTMFDLWGGTAMESNSALVIMLDHSRYKRDEKLPYVGYTYWLLEKNQFGPKAISVPVEVNHATLSIREAEPDEVSKYWDTAERVRDRKRR